MHVVYFKNIYNRAPLTKYRARAPSIHADPAASYIQSVFNFLDRIISDKTSWDHLCVFRNFDILSAHTHTHTHQNLNNINTFLRVYEMVVIYNGNSVDSWNCIVVCKTKNLINSVYLKISMYTIEHFDDLFKFEKNRFCLN